MEFGDGGTGRGDLGDAGFTGDAPADLQRHAVGRGDKPAVPPGSFEDAYGAGDCFAAGLTFALAQGMEIPDALAFASERGALALTRRGVGLTG